MKDELEEFVRRNRNEFDDREPSSDVWSRIESALGLRGQTWRSSLVWWRAAAIFFMALSLYLLSPLRVHTPVNVASVDQKAALKEFTDVEAFYVQQISNKVELIGQMNGADGLNGFTHDFLQLEAMYQVLKEEMKASPSQKVKDALVLNLLVRINLLNQQLQKLEEQQEAKGDKSA